MQKYNFYRCLTKKILNLITTNAKFFNQLAINTKIMNTNKSKLVVQALLFTISDETMNSFRLKSNLSSGIQFTTGEA